MSTLQINKYKSKLTFAIPLMAFTGILTLGILTINQDTDYDASATTTPVSSTVSYDDEYITISSSSAIDLTHDSVVTNSTSVYTIDNVTVSTNVSTGYELYLTSSNKTSSALTSNTTSDTIAATSGTGGELGTPAVLDDNSYGYAVPSGKIGNTSFNSDYSNPTSSSKWAGVPAGTSDRIRSTNSANESGDTTDVHYAANLNNAITPGTYTGSVTYSAVVTPTSGTYAMSVNPVISAPNTVATLTITSGPTTINTAANLGTSEVEVYFRQSGATKGTCTVTNVNASSGHLVTTCTAPALSAGSYDVMISVPRYGFKDILSSGYVIMMADTLRNVASAAGVTSMQADNLNTVCSFATTWVSGETDLSLTDTRDNNVYHIRKLADGNCWMVQNLRLTGDSLNAAGHSTTLKATDNDTDLASGEFMVPNSASWTSTSTTVKGLIAAADAPMDSTSGSKATGDLAYARGTYYSWPMAILNTGYIGKSSTQTNSVCPKGWDLPTYSGTLSFQTLYTSYSSNYANTMKAFDYYYNTNAGADYYLAGIFLSGRVSDSGSQGYWWSNTSQSVEADRAWFMNATTNSLNAATHWYRSYGATVRCVLAGS